MAFMAVFYKSLIKDLGAENRKLRSINARLKRSKKDTIEIIYPQPGITLVLTRGLSGTQNGAVFRAAHADPGATLYWHIDDEFVGQTVGEHELHVDPAPGGHVLTLIDSQGARRAQRFTVK
jgi:penicillin-binding protein 1C